MEWAYDPVQQWHWGYEYSYGKQLWQAVGNIYNCLHFSSDKLKNKKAPLRSVKLSCSGLFILFSYLEMNVNTSSLLPRTMQSSSPNRGEPQVSSITLLACLPERDRFPCCKKIYILWLWCAEPRAWLKGASGIWTWLLLFTRQELEPTKLFLQTAVSSLITLLSRWVWSDLSAGEWCHQL